MHGRIAAARRLCRFLLVVLLCGTLSQAALADRLLVFGASGKIGSEIVQEALGRGHDVIGVSRNPAKLTVDHPGFTAVKGDVTDVASFSGLASDVDVVIISVAGNTHGNEPEQATHAIAARIAIEALSGNEDAPYVLQIGGATTLYGSREEMAQNLPFPAEPGTATWGMFFGHLVALEAYRASDIAWTVLTPPLRIMGEQPRTGSYRTSTDGPVYDEEGNSTISRADLAVAAIDEVEHENFVGRRFTIGY